MTPVECRLKSDRTHSPECSVTTCGRHPLNGGHLVVSGVCQFLISSYNMSDLECGPNSDENLNSIDARFMLKNESP